MSSVYSRNRLAGRLDSRPKPLVPSQSRKQTDDSIKKQNNYAKILSKVVHSRLKFFSRLALLLTLIQTIFVVLPFRTSWIWFPFKWILFWAIATLIRFARDLTLKVETSTYSTLFQQIIGSVLSPEFVTLFSAFSIANIVNYGTVWAQSASLSYYIESPTKTIKPFVNDKFLYFWFFALTNTLTYTIVFLTQGKNQLKFKIGSYRQEPIEHLKKLPFLQILKQSSLFSISITVVTPIVYGTVRKFLFNSILFPLVWGLGLNHHLPRMAISISLYFQLFALTLLTTVIYELVNEIYNAYTMIGCLNVKKPLSAHSDNQLETLISGFKDIKHPFVRLTAFQELVYFSQTAEERKFFYKTPTTWTSILEQCSIVIRGTSMAVTADLSPAKVSPPPVQKNSIFGNSGTGRSPIEEEKQETNTDALFLPVEKPQPKQKTLAEQFQDHLLQLGKKVKKTDLLIKLEKESRNKNTQLVLDYITSNLSFLETLFVPSLSREAAKRVPNKVIVGDAVITIAEVLLHAKHEDRKNIITPTLTEVLTLLTRLYKATAEFLSDPPAKDTGNCCVRELNELTLDYFFKLVVLYNSILNDLILSPDVFKFAKWCTDTALDERMELSLNVELVVTDILLHTSSFDIEHLEHSSSGSSEKNHRQHHNNQDGGQKRRLGLTLETHGKSNSHSSTKTGPELHHLVVVRNLILNRGRRNTSSGAPGTSKPVDRTSKREHRGPTRNTDRDERHYDQHGFENQLNLSEKRQSQCLRTKATRIPTISPMIVLIVKVIKNIPIPSKKLENWALVPWNFSHVSNMTIQMASFNKDSPKIMVYNLGSTL
ncbi:hypothetical protein OGAPHI_001439 [Ogataea philodendri]|uniref:Nucleoporin NDC1 n=2 Tax=Saccharomycotina TaxID=147537 RepID=A0A9P8T7L6_9ASCO|nr:uncharacterized protein OGAPHI_001439 [Ogataea philodendri]KAH3669318.1 hypothetical protein OGAPHI_001439 [Ogataea philodendri]